MVFKCLFSRINFSIIVEVFEFYVTGTVNEVAGLHARLIGNTGRIACLGCTWCIFSIGGIPNKVIYSKVAVSFESPDIAIVRTLCKVIDISRSECIYCLAGDYTTL